MNKNERDRLRIATAAATQGEWGTIHGVDIVAYGGREIANCEYGGGSDREYANAEFIAKTDPPTITGMLDSMDRQDVQLEERAQQRKEHRKERVRFKAEIERLRGKHDDWVKECPDCDADLEYADKTCHSCGEVQR